MVTDGGSGDRGVALIAVLLLMMLVSGILAGFVTVVMGEQRLQRIQGDRDEAFYAAHGGIEKLTSDLGALFTRSYTPTGSQVSALADALPAMSGITFPATSEGTGYGITFTPDTNGNPASSVRSITTGPFQGFTGLVTPYWLSVTARTPTGSEARMLRQVQTVGIPLFQFGLFSETDLGFHSGGNFDFGGRVHTNGNLFLAAGATLTMADKVTAVGEVVRTHLMNGSAIGGSYPGNVRIITAPGSYRNLGTNEGSVIANLGSPLNEPLWTNLSIGTYNGNIRNGRTGARRLDLPLVFEGATPIELIRRPSAGEVTTSTVFQLRYFAQASLRILLSDTAQDITSLPGVTGTPPVELSANEPAGYAVDANHPPFAEGGGPPHGKVPAGTPLLGGFLKIEKQVSDGVWQDVTVEILNLGIAGPNLSRTCTEPNPNAVIRLQRIADLSTCSAGTTVPANYWPKMLYDTREALRREGESVSFSNVYLGGVMHYVELDVRNLTRWFQGQIGTSGTTVDHTTGYSVYFSDRRGNRDAAGRETGEYGFEDFVNPSSSTGTPNGALDSGEDVNGNGTLETYGATYTGGGLAWQNPLDGSARLWTAVIPDVAKRNPARFFRRALKIVNGRLGNIIAPGLTIASENPVYLQGDFNAAGGFGNPHVSCSIAADAVTLLSNNWSDQRSFDYPHRAASRPATNTWYRVAILAGKGVKFPRPTAGSPPINFGTDGGVHNFLRYLESWSNDTVYYRGSLASLYYNRQAVGVFKDGSNTYDFPNVRDFRFDIDFLDMNLLPPRTPLFRDVNVLGFTQILAAPR
ncbi:MAG: pilus assembly PilX N-terminal domain-containing protein [Acidobacteriota bacterium]